MPIPDLSRRNAPLQVVQRLAPAAAPLDADTLSVVASDESVDRYGDIIRAAGWELDHYRANPVVLFGHDSKQIVGTAEMQVKGKRLLATIELAQAGTSALVDMVRALVGQKILRATSVGFRPTKAPNEIKNDKNEWTGGYEFIAQELLELSLVAIPANPQALSLAKSFPLDVQRAVFARDPGVVTEHLIDKRARIEKLRSGVSGR
jgi:HK97 family phage prohead protease